MASVNKEIDIEFNISEEEIEILKKAKDILKREWGNVFEDDVDAAYEEALFVLDAKLAIERLLRQI